MPDFEGKLLPSGAPFHLADHIGSKMLVLNFIQSWSGPCRDELPALKTFQDAHRDEVEVIHLDPMEGLDIVQNFIQWGKIQLPVLPDDGTLQSKLGAAGYPYTVVIGVDGRIQHQAVGVVDVKGTLLRLLETNRGLRKSALTRDVYLKAVEGQHLALIHLAPPSIKPVPAPEAGRATEIKEIRVARESQTELEVDVDYYYSGDHGTQRVFMDCDPIVSGGGAPFAMRPMAINVGAGTARSYMSSYDQTPNGAVSTKVRCTIGSRIDHATLATKILEFRRSWKKP